ncbi:MAG: response regulator, partial [Cyanothece sp. SIO1E1]|nr:response regulator [Cyanothece sp. SIO1E1]
FATPNQQHTVPWYLGISEGRVIFSGEQWLSCLTVLKAVQRYVPRLQNERSKYTRLSLQQQLATDPSTLLLTKLNELYKQNLVNKKEVSNALRLKILADFDTYLFGSAGQANFLPFPTLASQSPIPGFELTDLLAEAQQRQQLWHQLQSQIPSMKSVPVLNLPRIENSSLTLAQKQRLKSLVSGEHTLSDIAIALAQDSIVVAQGFAKLVNQGLVTFNATDSPVLNGSATNSPATTSSVTNSPATTSSVTNSPATNSSATNSSVTNSSATDGSATDGSATDGSATDGSASPQVVIVDDSPLMLKQFQSLVTSWGYQVALLQNPTMAVETMVEINPAIVFLDVNMPGLNGFDLVKQIRRTPQLAAIPLIMLTAEKTLSNNWRAQWSGCKFLTKPLTPQEVPQFQVELRMVLEELAPLQTQSQYEHSSSLKEKIHAIPNY